MTSQLRKTLLRGGTILTGDPAVGEIRQGDLLIAGNTIAEIAPHIPIDDAETIDASGMIVMPGFVDSHRYHGSPCCVQSALTGLWGSTTPACA
ncbi:hypothetical protein ACU4GD_33980 [Cupriavidus basilensis]